MSRLVLSLISLFFGLFISQGALAAPVNGVTCKAHLGQITQIMNKSNLKAYWNIRDRYPNILGTKISDVVKLERASSNGINLATAATNVLNDCQQTCHGLRLNNGATFNCSKLKDYSIMEVFYGKNTIEDNATGDSETVEPIDLDEGSTNSETTVSKEVTDDGSLPTKQECINDNDQESELCYHHFADQGSSEQKPETSLDALFNGSLDGAQVIDPTNSAN